jgi:hypothetical protein
MNIMLCLHSQLKIVLGTLILFCSRQAVSLSPERQGLELHHSVGHVGATAVTVVIYFGIWNGCYVL